MATGWPTEPAVWVSHIHEHHQGAAGTAKLLVPTIPPAQEGRSRSSLFRQVLDGLVLLHGFLPTDAIKFLTDHIPGSALIQAVGAGRGGGLQIWNLQGLSRECKGSEHPISYRGVVLCACWMCMWFGPLQELEARSQNNEVSILLLLTNAAGTVKDVHICWGPNFALVLGGVQQQLCCALEDDALEHPPVLPLVTQVQPGHGGVRVAGVGSSCDRGGGSTVISASSGCICPGQPPGPTMTSAGLLSPSLPCGAPWGQGGWWPWRTQAATVILFFFFTFILLFSIYIYIYNGSLYRAYT